MKDQKEKKLGARKYSLRNGPKLSNVRKKKGGERRNQKEMGQKKRAKKKKIKNLKKIEPPSANAKKAIIRLRK